MYVTEGLSRIKMLQQVQVLEVPKKQGVVF